MSTNEPVSNFGAMPADSAIKVGHEAASTTPPAAPTPEAMKLAGDVFNQWLSDKNKSLSLQRQYAVAIDAHTAAKDAEIAALKKKQPITSHVRLWDLVRWVRSELHKADLITDEEYVELCQGLPADRKVAGSPSPRRLESYDELRARLTALEAAAEQARVALLALIYSANATADAMNTSAMDESIKSAGAALSALTEALKTKKP